MQHATLSLNFNTPLYYQTTTKTAPSQLAMFSVDTTSFHSSLSHHIPLFIFNLILVVTSLTFNSVVLFGAIKKQALKSDLTTVILLEMLTVLDLLITIVSVLPVTVTALSGGWRLGAILCVANATLTRYLYHTELLLLACISLHRLKLVLVRKGKRALNLNRNSLLLSQKIALFLIASLPVVPVLTTFSRHSKVPFVPSMMCCMAPSSAKPWVFVSLSFLIFPFTVAILSNLIILHKIMIIRIRSRPSLQTGFFSGLKNAINPGTKQKVNTQVRTINSSTYLTILVICTVLTVSYVPLFVLAIKDEITNPSPSWLGTLTIELLSLNVLANPVMYTLSNRRFRRYLANLVKCPLREDKGDDSLVLGESSGEKLFNETISKFFSERRKSSLLTNRSNSNLGSRSSLTSRWGSTARESEVRVQGTNSPTSSRVNLTELSRKVSSNCSVMPNVKEHETMNFLTPQPSPTKKRYNGQFSESSKLHRQSAPSLRIHCPSDSSDKTVDTKWTLKGSKSSSDVTKKKRSFSSTPRLSPIRRCDVSDIEPPVTVTRRKSNRVSSCKSPIPIIVHQSENGERCASLFTLCEPRIPNDHVIEDIL